MVWWLRQTGTIQAALSVVSLASPSGEYAKTTSRSSRSRWVGSQQQKRKRSTLFIRMRISTRRCVIYHNRNYAQTNMWCCLSHPAQYLHLYFSFHHNDYTDSVFTILDPEGRSRMDRREQEERKKEEEKIIPIQTPIFFFRGSKICHCTHRELLSVGTRVW